MNVPSTSSPLGSSKVEIPVVDPLPNFTTTNETYAHHLYGHIVSAQGLHEFLEESGFYDFSKRKWSIPDAPAKTEDLLGPLVKILSSIVGRFVQPSNPGIEREVVNTHGIPACQGRNEKGYRICPLVVVRAAGPSFEVPISRKATATTHVPSKRIGFGGMATYFAVKLDSELGREDEDLDEMESYARRILYAQRNRCFVRSLVITQKHIRLVHFDRSGAQVSPLINIHKHPATFIGLVAGLSSADEGLLGIDDSIQWIIVSGRKDKGTVTATNASGVTKVYPIIEEIAIPRDSIRGRATTCWRVEDPDTREELVIKDSWRPDDHTAEYELLELVKGITGVVQMVSHESSRRETKDLRCASTTGQYKNRVYERVIMKAYGGPLESFKTVLQLLCAIRDAIAGHERLVDEDIGILHRDISSFNILLGRAGAPAGERGILVDLDMAFRATKDQRTVPADPNVGTRFFQSLSVLISRDHRPGVRAHDYLDDLESFFYLLVYIFLRFKPDGTAIPNKEEGPSIVREWGNDDPSIANDRKCLVLAPGRVYARSLRLIEAAWGPVCGTLFKAFRRWVIQQRDAKTSLIYEGTRSNDPSPLSSLHAKREQQYLDVLTIFDEAIDAIGKLPAVTPPLGPSVASAIASSRVAEKQGAAMVSHDQEPVFYPTLDDTVLLAAPTCPLVAPPSSVPMVSPIVSPKSPLCSAQLITSTYTSLMQKRKRRPEDVADPEATQSKARRMKGVATCSP